MQEVERNRVQIDVCPSCKGVWLDRGELEGLMGQFRKVEEKYEKERKEYYHHYEKPYKKKGWMSKAMDIFD